MSEVSFAYRFEPGQMVLDPYDASVRRVLHRLRPGLLVDVSDQTQPLYVLSRHDGEREDPALFIHEEHTLTLADPDAVCDD
jgi:hypothetical protein